MRDKWNREDYQTATIERALAGRTEFFDWDRSRASTAAIQSTEDEPTPAARLTELLSLASVGLHITGARIVGKGGGASADLYLSDGTEITFEKLRDFAKPQVLRIEVIATTGAKPKLNGERAADALVLLRQVAERWPPPVALTDEAAFSSAWTRPAARRGTASGAPAASGSSGGLARCVSLGRARG